MCNKSEEKSTFQGSLKKMSHSKYKTAPMRRNEKVAYLL